MERTQHSVGRWTEEFSLCVPSPNLELSREESKKHECQFSTHCLMKMGLCLLQALQIHRDKIKIQEPITIQILVGYNLQCGPRSMFVLITIEVSRVWIQLGIKSSFARSFFSECPSPGPREMERERQTILVLLIEVCVLVSSPPGTLRDSLGGLGWRGACYKTFTAGAHDEQTPVPASACVKGTRTSPTLQSPSFRDSWRGRIIHSHLQNLLTSMQFLLNLIQL